MEETLPLGRAAGMRVGLHWSVLVVVVLMTVMLAVGRLSRPRPDHPEWAYGALTLQAAVILLASLLATVLFLASLLAHELAHAVAARRGGVRVEGTTLWMLGGIARLRSQPSTPRAELRIAVVGPPASAVAGGLCTGFALGLHALHASGLVVQAVAWPAALNFALAVVNTLPVAPLDGGRLLHAFLWHRTGDRVRATRSVSDAGRGLGRLMVVTGFVVMIFAGDLSGLWPALIGWFLITAATAEQRQAQLRGVLGEMPVSHLMIRAPVTVPATATLASFLAEGPFGRYHHSAFPVLAPDGTVAGLVTVRLINRIPIQSRSTTSIGDVMRPLSDVTTAAPDGLVVDLLPRLEASRDRRALVLDDGHLIGIATLADITRALAWHTTAARHRT